MLICMLFPIAIDAQEDLEKTDLSRAVMMLSTIQIRLDLN